MDTEVSSALSTLELDPRNKDARAALSRHPRPGKSIATSSPSALAAARSFHSERGNVELSSSWKLALTGDPGASHQPDKR